MKRGLLASAICGTVLMSSAAFAIAPGQETELPQTGEWSGSNWSWATAGVYQWNTTWNGNWYIGSAVAIAPNYLLTAGHVNGNTTDYAMINGVKYTAVESYIPPNDPGQSGPPDLRIIKVDKTLPTWNTLFTGQIVAGTNVTIIGYGQTGTDLFYGAVDWTSGTEGIGRWGTNTINTSRRVDSGGRSSQMFGFSYLWNETPYEAIAADGDSGGGVFIKVNNTWQLAGIITNSGTQATYAVSLPTYHDWIQNIVPIPEPTTLWALPAMLLLMRRRRRA